MSEFALRRRPIRASQHSDCDDINVDVGQGANALSNGGTGGEYIVDKNRPCAC